MQFSTLPAGTLFSEAQGPSSTARCNGGVDTLNAPGSQFELRNHSCQPSRPSGFASLTAALLGQQSAQQQPGRNMLSQVPLFDLARAAPGPAAETGLRVIKVDGDGRCMFRALAQGLSRNKGIFLGRTAEEQEADQLRLAVAEALCRTPKRRNEFAQAVYAVEAEDKIQNYCKRILTPTFWGGEPELLVLSQMLGVPILVYIPSKEAGSGGRGYIPIQRYGEKYAKTASGKRRKAVRLLYSGSNHYDLLLKH
ncbi:hypothetical protein D9Q98_006717 [Chlorella vulgaris]|uniref:Ubiquitin thioesterase OTU n=1 Tax=Chlorella vulgaris TaxID=3077 RepID=A0A9D4YV86_CHLVU|nr:hypothetical protein D9Q98_006717 [Chlorella vulgaris]